MNPRGTLEACVEAYRQEGHDAFLRNHAYPVLILLAAGVEEGEPGFKTRTARGLDPMGVGTPRPPSSERISWTRTVYPVVKRPGGVFKDKIGIGRARNVDVPIAVSEISKYHATITFAADRSEWFIADAGSRNGTFVRDQRLAPNEPTLIQSGARLRLGPYPFIFLTAEGFATYVRMQAG